MAKAIKIVRKREVKTVKNEPELAPDAKPIDLTFNDIKFDASYNPPRQYTMVCSAGRYDADSWLGLGWAIITHRLWHLWKDHSFKD
jgi:hypothetical protein